MSKKIKKDVESFARIKVVGIGGSGKNATNHMVRSKVKGVEFVVVNTDAQDLHNSLSKRKVHIGKHLTKGLGTGMNSDTGKRAAEETKEEIQEVLKGADMVFISGGLGGGTCTGASPVVAKAAKEMGALTVAVVTKPFSFEGSQRMRLAEKGAEDLKQEVDALIVIPNDRLLAIVGKETTATDAFAMADEVLREGVEGISDLITMPGIINVDFADIRAIMEDAGSALMGLGRAHGENRAVEAAKIAINSPLLDLSVNGAKGVLFVVAGGEDLTMSEIHEAANVITESVDPDAKIIFGAIKDDKLKKGEIKVTVIATGFPDGMTGKSSGGIFQFSGKDKEKKDSPVIKEEEIPTKEKKEEEDDWGAVPAFLRRAKK
ncbi:cell division protein FtsZ [Candidatus Campbellbacteria bacterium CG11_big_fil_rev_8_21_14_0_20_44_21]|uniref:Cell division protein FtsZ n=1 Tax=Candidatus Campbellbacteria bacterium CG22_combo_CG10-13_8_21_14_all_43_18 TaxID=1974530 RepID=A0A2H0DXA3_9BACT|nr:MAG: cell division protein FtsZ [Candidatus Campbellbacteria bacterium CG22_combo_CG10-13_8_21_14_all_43_18]PIR24414.1 MAG: cell division protein FtsZ [Candidatus Campbellbacteria bacterium CG11_big_fil_rev_8_21_14_0_20_44_21]